MRAGDTGTESALWQWSNAVAPWLFLPAEEHKRAPEGQAGTECVPQTLLGSIRVLQMVPPEESPGSYDTAWPLGTGQGPGPCDYGAVTDDSSLAKATESRLSGSESLQHSFI